MSDLPVPPPRPDIWTRDRLDERSLLAFDFDGTLVDLQRSPDDVTLPSETHEALAGIAPHVDVLICSGRSLPSLLRYLPRVPGLHLMGNHGQDWLLRREDGTEEHRVRTPVAWFKFHTRFLPRLADVIRQHGGRLEDKASSVAIHFRESGTEWWRSEQARGWLEAEVSSAGMSVLQGSLCWNVLPAGASKGEAIAQFVRGFDYQNVTYFGDEPTDETVFARTDLPRFVGVKVGPGSTSAALHLPSVSEVQKWVAGLARHFKSVPSEQLKSTRPVQELHT